MCLNKLNDEKRLYRRKLILKTLKFYHKFYVNQKNDRDISIVIMIIIKIIFVLLRVFKNSYER